MQKKSWKAKAIALFSACSILTGMGTAGMTANAESPDYGDALKMALYFYDANECGAEVDNNPLTWRGNCHTYDDSANLSSATGLGEAEKQVIRSQNGGKDIVDLTGGYHDAGDHIKSTMTMGFSGTSLAWSMYSHPEVFEQTDTTNHALDILHTMTEYFMKVTYLNDDSSVSSFCYLVGDQADHDTTWTSPEKQNYERKTYWATASHPSADAAGEMAACLASASVQFRKAGESDYADKCLKYAKALYEFAKQHPSAASDGIGSFYGSGSQQDDIAWADLWIHVAEESISTYQAITVSGDAYQTPAGTEYDGWIYSWDKVWGGYSALLAELGNSEHLQKTQQNANLIQNPQAGKYYFPKGGTEWGSSRYNCAWQMYAEKYGEKSGQTQYFDWAKTQMDYLLGQNPSGRSYLLGYTDNYPKNVHHRAANPNKNGMEHILYGALVGGETDQNGSYNDVWDSYSCTEPALDYEGCLILSLTELCAYYGTDGGTGTDSIIQSAPEIDGTHTFGTWLNNAPEPVTEPTDETETTEIETETEETTEESVTETTEIEPEPLYGDVNLDGSINVTDVIMMQKYLHGQQKISYDSFMISDMNQDGNVNIYDLVLLKKTLIAK